MILAHHKLEIPKEWCHNPLITNKNDETVAIILAE